MVIGVGIDIVKIDKMKTALEKWQSDFLNRVFSEEEVSSVAKGKLYYQRLSGKFAAKEAVIKATSKKYALGFKDILVLNRENGAPYCKLLKKMPIEVLLSISHIEDYAVAMAIAQKKA